MRRLADEAGFFRLGMPKALEGNDASLLTSEFGLGGTARGADWWRSGDREGAPEREGDRWVSFLRQGLTSADIFHGGLHNDAQSEHCIVGNVPLALVVLDAGTEEQKREFLPKLLTSEYIMSFGLTVCVAFYITLSWLTRNPGTRSWIGRDAHGDDRRARRRRVGHLGREDVEYGFVH